MDMKRIAIGTIIGGITMLTAGYVIFGIAVADFYASNSFGGTYRDVPVLWALILGNFSMAALATLGIESREGAPTIAGGATTAAVIGFLVWLGADFIIYAVTNVWGLASTIVDPFLSALNFGIAGAAIAAVLARVPKGNLKRPAA